MNILKFTNIIILCLFCFASGSTALTALEGPASIIKKSDYIIYGKTFKCDMIINVYRDSEVYSTMKMHAMLKGNSRMACFFYYPNRSKDSALLKNGDNMWIFFPGNKRFLNIGAKQNMGGSDFSYGDILNVKLASDYNAAYEDSPAQFNEESCYRIVLTAKKQTATYDKVICYIRKKDLAPLKREFYAKSGKLIKEMEFDNFKGAKPMKYIMKSVLKQNEYSVMEFENLEMNIEIDDTTFTKKYILLHN